jgi:hydrogenase maturation protein HypF
MVRVVEKSDEKTRRLKVIIHGAVQGVGFRPFVYRLATEMKLNGWVSNTSQGVFIEVEGEQSSLQTFISKIHSEKPSLAKILSFEHSFLDPKGFTHFEIKESSNNGSKSVLVLPDIAVCPDCLNDVFDPNNRRYLYPFTNCTNCGPRFTIIQSLPYDRKNTTMKIFPMCDECEKEYRDPATRRFHAQPNACPKCGPHVELWNSSGDVEVKHHQAMLQVVELLLKGNIVAVKGLGGFHLMCDARNDDVVQKLRTRKHREEKPFAVMFPSFDELQKECEVSDLEKRLLLSSESPIVLLKKKINVIPRSETTRNLNSDVTKNDEIPRSSLRDFARNDNQQEWIIAQSVAPKNPFLGAMLPYTPLHHILLSLTGIPLVATSGNISDEPICTDEYQAMKKLKSIADYFLVHNRPIERYCDDSIVRVVHGRELVMRRARGYAPLPIQLPMNLERPILAVGGHLKNTIALAHHNSIFISQYIGDLETPDSLTAFKKTINDFQSLYGIVPLHIVHDLHPNYVSTITAKNELAHQYPKAAIVPIQHHFAHIASCMAENELTGTVLGFSWDGTGYGTDGTVWGGECILVDGKKISRVGTIRSFKLPGGESAVKEPRRCAAGILFELFGKECFEHSNEISNAFLEHEQKMIVEMLLKNINSPVTTSMGRLFDAVAALLGIRMKSSFEGQSAMEVEFLAYESSTTASYSIEIIQKNGLFEWDWRSMIAELLGDIETYVPKSEVARKFHNTLSKVIVEIAKKNNISRVLLSGGCFQNVILLEQSITLLRRNGFTPYWHQRIPTNDGGISLGQVYSVVLQLQFIN